MMTLISDPRIDPYVPVDVADAETFQEIVKDLVKDLDKEPLVGIGYVDPVCFIQNVLRNQDKLHALLDLTRNPPATPTVQAPSEDVSERRTGTLRPAYGLPQPGNSSLLSAASGHRVKEA